MYASLMISLLAAFIAMLGKHWLNRYLRNSGGSMIERCGDRQRKFNELKKWPFDFIIESLPAMLQVALLLLAGGLCQHMWSINTPVALVLITFTVLGLIFYFTITTAGSSSDACPFRTPFSTFFGTFWIKVLRWIVSLIVHSKRVLSRTHRVWKRRVRSLLHRQSQPTILLEVVQVHRPKPWLNPEDFTIIRKNNADDAQCTSWILGNITDSETLDAALPLAGEIQWFGCGVDVRPIYDQILSPISCEVDVRPIYYQIVSTFKSCFDSTGTLYPGSRDRAYYSGRAMLWICIIGARRARARTFFHVIPPGKYATRAPDPDLEHLLELIVGRWEYSGHNIKSLLRISPGHTPLHLQWISNLLLHWSLSVGTGIHLDDISGAHEIKTTTPLNVKLNRLLTWCTFLGLPVEEEVLMIQNKSCGISYFCSSGC